ncbi:MAG: hypothetical protein WC661_20670 [Opitutaceae bacterium]|jgi:hypothetical protein
MSAGPRFFLSENGLRTGPHSLVVLKQKAEIGVLRPDTSIAPESAPDDWSPIHESQILSEELFPARRQFTLGSRPVEIANTADVAAAPSVDEILRSNLARQRAAEGELLKPLPPRSNKRRKDYLILAGGVNAIVAIRLLQGAPLFDPFLVGFFAMGNISLVWVMFFVMDRY